MEAQIQPNSHNLKWVHFDSHEDENDEEALSLSDLPTIQQQTDSNSNNSRLLEEDDFDFTSSLAAAGSDLPETQMCSADEVFFRGQILPLRHSVSSDKTGSGSGSFSRSASTSVVSSRSSSIRSHSSLSSGSGSGSGSSTSTYGPGMVRANGYKPRIRNQFHSHPSPTPQIRTASFRHSNPKTSSIWSFLQVGLLKPQEIGLADLKNRSKRSGSHNSSSSGTSSSRNCTTMEKKKKKKKKKKKQRIMLGGCKCSVNAIESTMVKQTKSKEKTKKVMENRTYLRMSEERINVGERKERVTRHRTFEWLKQLSIQESED